MVRVVLILVVNDCTAWARPQEGKSNQRVRVVSLRASQVKFAISVPVL